MQKDAKSLEDQIMTVDVVETYVPIMHEDNFLGAFEIYFDITNRNQELSKKETTPVRIIYRKRLCIAGVEVELLPNVKSPITYTTKI